MLKVFRNTVFTLAVLGLTALGVGWNHEIARTREPVALQKAVLASQTTVSEKPNFPLAISFDRPVVKLGQYQVVHFQTVPEATLDIVVVFPGGTTDTRKAQTDGQGQYDFRFKLNDFHHLGIFKVSVVATSGNKTAERTGQFLLQTWAEPAPTKTDDSYVYPLVP